MLEPVAIEDVMEQSSQKKNVNQVKLKCCLRQQPTIPAESSHPILPAQSYS
jgi:hypothetical protein